MSSDCKSPSRSRSRSPMDRKIRSDRFSYRGAPYRRDSRWSFSNQSNLCKNCKRPGHFARECPNMAICHNCGLLGTLLPSALQSHSAGTVGSLGIWPATVQIRVNATPVGRLDIVLGTIQPHQCHLVTLGCATTVISRAI